jgi:hypothetical protein
MKRGLPSNTVERNGRLYYQAKPAARALGIQSEALGPDSPKARARAKRLNRDLARRRKEDSAARSCAQVNGFVLNMAAFAQSYRSKSERTSEERLTKLLPRPPVKSTNETNRKRQSILSSMLAFANNPSRMAQSAAPSASDLFQTRRRGL